MVYNIHLNPLRAGLVPDSKTLAMYPYSSHSVLMTTEAYEWQNTDKVLKLFGEESGFGKW